MVSSIAFMVVLALVIAYGLGFMKWFLNRREAAKRISELSGTVSRELSQPKQPETYGHPTDIKQTLLDALPDPAKRKAEHIRWELKIDVAGDQADGESVFMNDAIATITLVDLKAEKSSEEAAQRNYNLTRLHHRGLNKYVTYAECFNSPVPGLRMAAKDSVRKMVKEVAEWSQKAQDDYEYEHCPPEPYVKMK